MDGFSNLEENFHRYSGLIYDGAFSENQSIFNGKGLTGDDVDINPLFRFVEDDYSAERVSGQLTKVGDLKNDSKLKAAGICL